MAVRPSARQERPRWFSSNSRRVPWFIGVFVGSVALRLSHPMVLGNPFPPPTSPFFWSNLAGKNP